MSDSAQGTRRHAVEAMLGLVLIATLLWVGRSFEIAGRSVDPPRLFAETAAPAPRLARTFTHPDEVSSLVFSPDGRHLAASGSLSRKVSVWEVATGKLARRHEAEPGAVTALAWSPDGRYLAAGRQFVRLIRGRLAINVWDAASGALVHNLPGPFDADDASNDVRALAFSPDGRRLGSGRWLGGVTVHDPASGALLTAVKGHITLGWVLAWSPDGRRLITNGDGKAAAIDILDAATGATVERLPAVAEPPRTLALSPEGRFLAAGAFETGAITIWDLEAGGTVRSFVAHAARVKALAYSPDGRWLASASPRRAVKIWAADSGQLLLTLPRPEEPTDVLAWSPDGRSLACGAGDSIRLWDLAALGRRP